MLQIFFTSPEERERITDPIGTGSLCERMSDLLAPNLTQRSRSASEFLHFLFTIAVASKDEPLESRRIDKLLRMEKALKIFWTKSNKPYTSTGKNTVRPYVRDQLWREYLTRGELSAFNINNLRDQGIYGSYVRPAIKTGLVSSTSLELKRQAFPVTRVSEGVEKLCNAAKVEFEYCNELYNYLLKRRTWLGNNIFGNVPETGRYAEIVRRQAPFSGVVPAKIKDRNFRERVKAAMALKPFCENLKEYFDLKLAGAIDGQKTAYTARQRSLMQEVLRKKKQILGILRSMELEKNGELFTHFLNGLTAAKFNLRLLELHRTIAKGRNNDCPMLLRIQDNRWHPESPYANIYLDSVRGVSRYDMRWGVVYGLKKETKWKPSATHKAC